MFLKNIIFYTFTSKFHILCNVLNFINNYRVKVNKRKCNHTVKIYFLEVINKTKIISVGCTIIIFCLFTSKCHV